MLTQGVCHSQSRGDSYNISALRDFLKINGNKHSAFLPLWQIESKTHIHQILPEEHSWMPNSSQLMTTHSTVISGEQLVVREAFSGA